MSQPEVKEYYHLLLANFQFSFWAFVRKLELLLCVKHWWWFFLPVIKSSYLDVFFKINVLKSFKKSTWKHLISLYQLFCAWVPCHKETSSLICRANQWTGFYMITATVMKELNSTGVFLWIPLTPFFCRTSANRFEHCNNKVKSTLSVLRQFLTTENHLKMMKSAF